jgi:hypothetical protein
MIKRILFIRSYSLATTLTSRSDGGDERILEPAGVSWNPLEAEKFEERVPSLITTVRRRRSLITPGLLQPWDIEKPKQLNTEGVWLEWELLQS